MLGCYIFTPGGLVLWKKESKIKRAEFELVIRSVMIPQPQLESHISKNSYYWKQVASCICCISSPFALDWLPALCGVVLDAFVAKQLTSDVFESIYTEFEARVLLLSK